jgi:replicative DNA helicase
MAKAYRGERQEDGSLKSVDGAIVGFFSLEMSAEQLATRIVCRAGGGLVLEDPPRHDHRGRVPQARRIRRSQEMSRAPLYIDQTGGISIAQLAARARRLKRSEGARPPDRGLPPAALGLVQEGRQPRSGNHRDHHRPEGLGQGARVPIVALSPALASGRAARRQAPQLSDLRESGSIEQDADVVMFVFREEYYVEGKKPREGTPEFNDWQTQRWLSAARPR